MKKQPLVVDRELMLAQLRYSGMLETIRVRRAGFAARMKFEDFLPRFTILSPDVAKGAQANPEAACRKIFEKIKAPKETWQIGFSKVCLYPPSKRKSGVHESCYGKHTRKIAQ